MLDVHGAFEEDEYEKEEKEREKRVEKMNEEVEGEKNVIYSLLKERLQKSLTDLDEQASIIELLK